MDYIKKFGILIAFLCYGIVNDVHAFTCTNGAEVSREKYCKYFKAYRARSAPSDPRISNIIGGESRSKSRAIALLIGISSYPNLPEKFKSLAPAHTDVVKLTNFLITEQKFDEVIVLENADATLEAINFFLGDYVPQQGVESNRNGRFLLAYSGHGTNISATQGASFLLSAAKSPDDVSQMYPMEDLRARLQTISRNYFHSLALINACFGGNTLGSGKFGGNPSTVELRGSYALTAGPDDKPVASFGGIRDGSIFFDSIINGITTGQADTDYARLIAGDGRLVQQGGLTRLGALATFLDTEIELINRRKIQTSDGILKLGKPWIGPVEPDTVRALGGFFFLSPIKLGRGQAEPISVPPGPLSSIPGRPDIKVFNAQENYPIRGIDVSVHEGDIDWNIVRQKGLEGLRFVYVRASSWAGVDPAFEKHWRQVNVVGLDRGAYHVFDFCLTPQEQASEIFSQVARDDRALPFALSVQIPPKGFNKKQYACYTAMPNETVRGRILEILSILESHYGKTPVAYGNRSSLREVLDKRFDKYMVWLAVYKSSQKATAQDLGLEGSNPWTLWQYTASSDIPGIGKNVDANVFFGDEKQYVDFKLGRHNVALDAARR
ncbi:GH25 family lysozyme [Caballeronia cordobensis]|uniref:GH25 family lysozyme n=1 Tax=Caballeronia cordobensis TaxID=1353886 RepID=UPI00045F0739|nr:putative membrane protein [Burkholderia sp. RPE67]